MTTYAGEIGVGKDSRTWIVDSATPDFFLKTDSAQLPLTTRVGCGSRRGGAFELVLARHLPSCRAPSRFIRR